jgi:DNA-binding NtrC family response regulator
VKLLAIDDDEPTLALIRAALKHRDLEITTVSDPVQALALMNRERPHVVLLDLMLPKLSGLEVLERIVHAYPETSVIMMTAHYSTESAVQAIQKGASDYLEKPLALDRLRKRIDDLLQEARRQIDAHNLENELLTLCSFEGIVGRSPLMHEVFAKVRRVAPHYRTLLLTGATGTGKELIARALHRESPVSNRTFVVCNCAALPNDLIESELFGYTKGAFTGAVSDKLGLFEAAEGGTLFLDEIGELPLRSQAKLLRVIQNREIQRLGSVSSRKVNVRLVCATNRDLRAQVETKEFREDLFFRISMVEIQLPRLADRREDLPLLIRHFVKQFSAAYEKRIEGITHRAEAVLARYSWPGNIRELENVIGYACMMTDSEILDFHHLPDSLKLAPIQPAENLEVLSLDEMQRVHARRMLSYFSGDKVRTAEVLGVSRSTLYRLLSHDNRRKSDEVETLEGNSISSAELDGTRS